MLHYQEIWYNMGMTPRIFSDEQELEIARMYKVGLSARAIGRLCGLSSHTAILGALKRTGTIQRSPAERNEKYYVNPHAFDIIDNEAKAYWWGFLYADGHTYNRSLVLALATKDKEHLKRFKKFLNSGHPIKVRYVTAQGKVHPIAVLFVTNENLINRLRQLGITTNRTTFEWSISQLPSHLKHHWIRGFIDGDGSISIQKNKQAALKICGKPEELKWIRQQFHLEINRNAQHTISKHSTANIHYLSYFGNIQCPLIRDYLYQGATIFLYRKRNIFQKVNPAPPRERNSKGQFI